MQQCIKSRASESLDGNVKRVIRQAFQSVHDGFSPDRVVADTALNAKFLLACKSLGADAPAEVLNRHLYNARKASLLAGIPTTRRTTFRDLDEYRFASEVAARFLEHRSQVTVDDILCGPDLASEFDKFATGIAPGFTSLKYRWAALNLRKSKRLCPELLAHVVVPTAVEIGRLDEIDIAKLPMEQGIYIVYGLAGALYVGECENLRLRIKKHLEHSDIPAIARHFWEHGTSDLHLEIQVLPPTTSVRVRRALEAELINSRRAAFNIKRA